MNPVIKAQKRAEAALSEKKSQTLDYEWIAIKHQKKMYIRSLKTMAHSLDTLYTNLTGDSPWRS